MEGLGVAANVIAVVDLSTKVATLCFQYSKEVAGARGDIERLASQVQQLGTAIRAAQHLVEGTRGQSLPTSRSLLESIRACSTDLERLDNTLDSSYRRKSRMRRLGLRALKWPFSSKEVDQAISSLQRHEKTIVFGLQIDQTSVLVDVQQRVRRLGLQATEDSDPAVSRGSHRMMPFSPNPDFVRRPQIEEWLRVQYEGGAQRMALVGMGGFGKSQLAITFAHQVYTDRRGTTSIFWVRGNSRATFEDSYRTLADVLALPRRHDPEIYVPALVRDWLQRDDISPWLMVLDNADDASIFYSEKGHDDGSRGKELLASYLPKSVNGKILVTSRSLDAAEKLAGSSRAIFRIPIMGDDQALQVLRNGLESEADEAAAVELVAVLGHIPLAVNQAAAYINRRHPRVSVASYLEEFRKSEKRKDSLLRSDKGDLGRNDGVSNSVVVTWQVTFEQIKRERPRAADLLALMSQFQSQNIPEDMLRSYSGDEGHAENLDAATGGEMHDREGFENDVDTLWGYSLVSVSSTGFFEMHPLVQLCTRSWVSEFGNPRRWTRLFIHLAAIHFPSGDFDTWATCQSLLPHIEPVLNKKARSQGDPLQWATLLIKVGWYVHQMGEYSRAAMLAEDALEARKDILGSSHPATLASMSSLANVYAEQGRREEAEKLEVEVMNASIARYGIDHPNTLTCMANLAATYNNQERWEQAEEMFVQVVERCTANLGPDHVDTLASMADLASTYRGQYRWEEAEKLETEAFEAFKAKLGADHPDTLTTMHNLAKTLHGSGRTDKGIALMQGCLRLRQQKLGPAHPSTQYSAWLLQEWQSN